MPTPLGGGLTVLIRCEYRSHHNWMAFASYYSLQKNLPDAHVVLANRRAERMDRVMAVWPSRCRLKSFSYKPADGWEPGQIVAASGATGEVLLVEAGTMAIRELSDKVLGEMSLPGVRSGEDGTTWYFKDVPTETMVKSHEAAVRMPGLSSDVLSETLPVFVTYGTSVGKFVTGNWIDKAEYPFPMAEQFASTMLTANEAGVLKLWKQINPVFGTVSKE